MFAISKQQSKNRSAFMRIFVTGGTGFIGSHLVKQAMQQGEEVVVLRRSPTSVPRIQWDSSPVFVDAEMADVKREDFENCDAVVHLAAHSAKVPYDTMENCILHNVLEPLKLVQTAISAGVTRFVIAGSCFEYGTSGERYERIPVDAPLEPTSTYATSKAMASIAFSGLASMTNSQISIHRIFHVFGEGGELDSRMWPSMRRAALNGEDFEMSAGEQLRDFIPVEEVASKLLKAATDATENCGAAKIVNLGTGKAQTLSQFARFWWHKWNAPGQLKIGAVPYRQNEVMCYVPEI